MKKILIGIMSLAIIATSCKKKPEACIDGPTVVEPSSTHTYTYCGDSDGEVTWQFNGEEYTGESVDITFYDFAGEAQIHQDVQVKTWGFNRDAEDATYKVDVTYGQNPPLYIKARNYLYDQGLTSVEEIPGATVRLYTSETCWENATNSELCLAAEATADADGMVLFEGLDPAKVYILDAQDGEYRTNWSSNIRNMEIKDWAYDDGIGGFTSSYTEQNPYSANLKLSPMAHLIGASKWNLTDQKINGTSSWDVVSACAKDNYLTFALDLTWEYSEGADVCPTDNSSSGTNSWAEGNSTALQLEDYYLSMTTTSGTAGFSNASIDVSANTLTISATINGNTVENIFTRVE